MIIGKLNYDKDGLLIKAITEDYMFTLTEGDSNSIKSCEVVFKEDYSIFKKNDIINFNLNLDTHKAEFTKYNDLKIFSDTTELEVPGQSYTLTLYKIYLKLKDNQKKHLFSFIFDIVLNEVIIYRIYDVNDNLIDSVSVSNVMDSGNLLQYTIHDNKISDNGITIKVFKNDKGYTKSKVVNIDGDKQSYTYKYSKDMFNGVWIHMVKPGEEEENNIQIVTPKERE